MAIGRVLPINRAKGTGGYNEGDPYPKAAMQSVTMGVRVGASNYAIGYVHEFNWNMDRDNAVLHQIEPFPNGTFGTTGTFGVDFFESNYWPGEPIEIIPGKVGGVSITLNRYSLYTSNLLASVFRLQEKLDGSPVGNIEEDVDGMTDPVNMDGTAPNNYVSLIQQVRPVDLYQVFYSPYDGSLIFGRKFEECWFSSIGEDIPTSDENGPILENGELLATRVRPYNKDSLA